MDLKVRYAKCSNMGDMLNEAIIKEVFGYNVICSPTGTAELSAIGSGLGVFISNRSLKSFAKMLLYRPFSPKVYIWGTGFIKYSDEKNFVIRNLDIVALRGQLSKERAERALNKELSCVLSDGGILASYLLNEKIEKKYSVGVIPHFREQEDPIFKTIASSYNDSLLIDVCQDPHVVIKQIAQCECIISSSLHGLIIADSLKIPNIHVVYSNELKGDGFKFDDYYSSYGLKHPFVVLKHNECPSLFDVVNNYQIKDIEVEKKKRDMIESFPFTHDFKY